MPKETVRRRNKRPERGSVRVRRPSMPRDLAPEGRAEWRRVVGLLDEMGHIHETDRSLLVRYCRAWEDWNEYDRLLTQTSPLIKGVKGALVRNPLWMLRRDTGVTLTELAVQLGITPTARLRNGVKHERDADDGAEENRPAVLDHYRRMVGG